ncbi:hypothetical protein B0T25DRAFT_521302 [Lasiosphaeria hispida]|uniref:Uncharacterized protein n=1 Tax=Lasiosphaeria hispida TaxID=260671 RepID=A0AAJ0MB64_9PEZI|nr:hypothetical protein B0T25DRAFT_521302 [Lasiosphaeria hispida]
MSLKQLLFSLAVLGRSSAMPADEPNPNSWIGKKFTFYVWGNDIPGLQLFYLNGQAVAADYATANTSSDLVPVTFTSTKFFLPRPSSSNRAYSYLATPDPLAPVSNPSTLSPPFTSAYLTIPTPDEPATSLHPVSFTPSTSTLSDVPNTTTKTGGFINLERTFKVVGDRDTEGIIRYSLFCAFPSKEREGVWDLRWNVTNMEGDGGRPVSLREYPYKGSSKLTGEGGRCLTRGA